MVKFGATDAVEASGKSTCNSIAVDKIYAVEDPGVATVCSILCCNWLCRCIFHRVKSINPDAGSFHIFLEILKIVFLVFSYRYFSIAKPQIFLINYL